MQVTTLKVNLETGERTLTHKYVEGAAKGREFIHMGALALSGCKTHRVITVLPELLVYASDKYRWNVYLDTCSE